MLCWYLIAEIFPFSLLLVDRYQNGDYSSSCPSSSQTQFGTFCYITETFIKAGSVEEVNIR